MSEQETREGKRDKRDGARAIELRRHFTRADEGVFDAVEWELRTAAIRSEDGEVIFEQQDVEIPASWSPLATTIVASKYFRAQPDTPYRERSVKQLITRVVDTLEGWGREGGYFADDAQAETFADELAYLLVHQKACFN